LRGRTINWRIAVAICVTALGALFAAAVLRPTSPAPQPTSPTPRQDTVKSPLPAKVRVYRSEREPPPKEHSKHIIKVWLTEHKGRTFRVIQLPRCEHMEAVIAHEPSGETVQRAKRRLGGVTAMTGSFHDPRTMALVDFLQRKGNISSHATTGRWFLAITWGQVSDISDNYLLVKGKSGVSVIALGQRLVPLHRDGFSLGFMNRVTDRMALGMSKNYIFIVQGKSDIWRLAHFMQHKLPVKIALNSDGGHTVRGKAPVHIVFRWRTPAGQGSGPSGRALRL